MGSQVYADQVARLDHRTLQVMHDIIAAQFRYVNFEILIQCQLPGVFYKISDHDYFTGIWLEFYTETISEVFERKPSLIRHVLTAVTYPNPGTRGKEAENNIIMILKDLYPEIIPIIW